MSILHYAAVHFVFSNRLPWSLVSAFLGCFLLIRRTWPTLLVSWHLVALRPVINWANSELLYAYRILLHPICTNSLLLVELNICTLAGCICFLIYADYLYYSNCKEINLTCYHYIYYSRIVQAHSLYTWIINIYNYN